jgi:hypothetical protein
LKKNTKPPFPAHQISKWFYDTSTGTTTKAARCGLEELRSLEFQLWRKHSGHEDLRDSGCQSLILCIHGKDCCIAVCGVVQVLS